MTPRVLPSSSRPRPSRVRPRHQLLAAAQASCLAHPWRSRLRADDPSGVAFQLKTTSFTRPPTTPAIGRCTSQLFSTPLAISPCFGLMTPWVLPSSSRPRPSRVRPRHQLLAAAQASCLAHPWRSRLRADDPLGVAFQLKTMTTLSSHKSAVGHTLGDLALGLMTSCGASPSTCLSSYKLRKSSSTYRRPFKP
jgi:hypothetical protein